MAIRMVNATVSPGRHVVHTPVDKDGKPSGAERLYMPGQTVSLPEDDVKRLRESGFLVDPDGGSQVQDPDGPMVLTQES